jgi:hypothetical protein
MKHALTLYIDPNNQKDIDYLKGIIQGFAEGKKIQFDGPVGWEDADYGQITLQLSPPDSPYRTIQKSVRIKPIEFPTPPEGEEWHNPEGFDATKVEVDKGYRLLLKSEIGEKTESHPLRDKCDAFSQVYKAWCDGNWGKCIPITYRTKVPLPTKKTITAIAYEY